jgi:hypothetical protein
MKLYASKLEIVEPTFLWLLIPFLPLWTYLLFNLV